MKKDVKLLSAVDKEITKSIEAGHVEPAAARREGEPTHYLSIFAVSKTANAAKDPKIRVVKDAGSRGKKRGGFE